MEFPLEILTKPQQLQKANGIFRLMEPEFANILDGFLENFDVVREKEGLHITDPIVLKNLPHSLAATQTDWKWRVYSLQLLMNRINTGKAQKTLEIGAWNGWLSKYLAEGENQVIAADYFTHKYDGLRAIPGEKPNIFPVQTDSRAIPKSFRENSFDLIVLNHCLSFFENPTGYFSSLIPLLKKNGTIISLGSTIYRKSSQKEKELKKIAEGFKKKHGFDIFFVPVKGFLDAKDKENFKKEGCQIIPYKKMRLKNLLSSLSPSRPYYCAIIYRKSR